MNNHIAYPSLDRFYSALAELDAYQQVNETNYPLPQLAVDQAEKAQRIGVSYRDFLVGAAAIARTGSGLLVVHGANYKPEQAGETNLHAERVALHKIGRKVSEIAYLAIAGKPQPDQQSGCFLQLCTLADYVVTCCRAAISSPRKLLS